MFKKKVSPVMTTVDHENLVPGVEASEIRPSNPDEVVVGGKLFRKEAYQEDGPHSATKFRLVEVK